MKYILHYLSLALSLSSCIGYRFLPEGEKLLVKDPKLIGLSTNQEKEIENFVTQKANKRLASLLPISYLANIYELGNLRYDTAIYQTKMKSLNIEDNSTISKLNNPRHITRITKKVNKKIDKKGIIC